MPTTATAADPLARALMPVLLHRLNNATQVLAGWNSLLGIPAADALLARRADDLADAARTTDDVGWALAVLASAAGADLLLERRSARGLEPILAFVREALRRAGRDLAVPAERLPSLASEAPGGSEPWAAAWVAASWLHACGAALPAGETLRWDLGRGRDGWTLACEGVGDAAFAAARAAIEARVAGCGFELARGRAAVRLPAGSIVAGSIVDRPIVEGEAR